MEFKMTKLVYVALGVIVLAGAASMVSATPERAGGAPTAAQEGMDIRSIERSMDVKTLPQNELDPTVFQ
jgi:hypothetical protein